MLFAGIVISAVAMFLGVITKFPQGGGGLQNNLMVLGFFLPAPPLLPPPLQKQIPFDLETAIVENQMYYLRNPVVTSNGTYGPMPRPLQTPPSAARSSNPPTENATFAFSAFTFPPFSLPAELIQFWESIGTTIMVLMALCLPWLVIKKINSLGKAGPALHAASKPILTGFGELVTQIEPHDPLLKDLRIVIVERNRTSADLLSITKQAREAEKMAAERDAGKEEELRGLRAERNKVLEELKRERETVEKLEEEQKREVDGLREEASSQMKAWTGKEKKWEDERAKDKNRHVEDLDSINMAREMEVEAWRKQVEDLEDEKKRAKEAFGAKLKNILERMKKEREGWSKEKEDWKERREEEVAEKEKMAREKEEIEEKRNEEKEVWDEGNDRAQRRIAVLEKENQKLKEGEAKRQKKAAEAEAARKTAEAKKEEEEKCSEEAQKEAKNTIAMLEEEVFNGRKLIEDLQGDKRRDRQMLIELRAQLVRPTYAVPPGHINSLRFGGSAPPFMGTPFIAGPSAFPPTFPPAFPPTAPPNISDHRSPLLQPPSTNGDATSLRTTKCPLTPPACTNPCQYTSTHLTTLKRAQRAKTKLVNGLLLCEVGGIGKGNTGMNGAWSR